ncbi:MAG: pyridoxal phosphate-dependent aminotransferase [Myxococcota bacterium]
MDRTFRNVPRTGVIYVMNEAARRGFHYGHPSWANLGQGAPQTDALPGSAPRLEHIDVPPETHEYAPVAGLPALREAVAKLYNARYRTGKASQYTADNVAISAGGRTGLTRIAANLGPINLGHLLPDYTAYEELLEVFRAFTPFPVLTHARDGFRLTPETLEDTIVGAGLGAVLLSNPCNPTGQVVMGADLARFVQIARTFDCALILDEFYSHYVYSHELGTTVSAAAHVENVDTDPVVLVDGLTKNWRYPGWRLSWTVGPKSVIEGLASAGSFLDGGPPHPLQRAALPLLDPEVAHQEARAIQSAFSEKRAYMLRRLETIGLEVARAPKGAFYCFASLEHMPKSLQDGMAFFRAALEHEVICVPGSFFDVDPGHRRDHIPSRLRGWVRLSYGPDMPTLERGLDRLEALVAAHR